MDICINIFFVVHELGYYFKIMIEVSLFVRKWEMGPCNISSTSNIVHSKVVLTLTASNFPELESDVSSDSSRRRNMIPFANYVTPIFPTRLACVILFYYIEGGSREVCILQVVACISKMPPWTFLSENSDILCN